MMERRSFDPKFIAIQFVVWVVGAVILFQMLSSRVDVLESRQGMSERRLERIELKIDQLLDRR